VDPQAADLADLVARASSRSKPRFDRCYLSATKALPPEAALQGTLQIAFRILASGQVEGAAAVENATGSDQLARCLVAEISAWTFPPHVGDPVEFVRPFTFQPYQQPAGAP
jgi:hypothetical protein